MAIAKHGQHTGHGKHNGHHHQASHHQAPPVVVGGNVPPPAPVHVVYVPTGPETRVAPDANGVVHLPGGTSLQDVHIVGRDLVVQLPDGSHILIVDGAVFPPQLVIGDVQVPPQNLAALVIGSEVQPAAGPNQSSGGNFVEPPGNIGPGFPISPLLPPTELAFGIPQFQILPELVPPNHAPIAGVGAATVSEEVLPSGNDDQSGGAEPPNDSDTLVATGQISVSDPDSGDTLTVTLGTDVGAPLTSGGVAIVWTSSDGGHTLTGTAGAGGPTIITITIDNQGDFTVTLSGHLDHPTGAGENLLTFDVPVVVTDNHGASTPTSLTVNVEDDTPFVTLADVSTPSVTVSEVTLGTPGTADFSVVFNDHFGADGAAASGPKAYSLSIVSSGADSGLIDTATGNHVFLFLENGQVVGREGANAQAAASGSIDFTIAVNASTGVVTLTQDRALVQPDGTQPDTHEPVSMASGLVSVTQTITDGDGDQASASADISAQLHFLDAGPTANSDTNSVNAGDTLQVLAGSVADVLHNDSSGADGYHANPGPVVGVEAGSNTSAPVTTGVGDQIQGQFGILTLNADGSYTYQETAPVQATSVDHFVYTIEDGDGDYSTTTLDITVNFVNVPPTIGNAETTVSEEVLPAGNNDGGGSDNDAGNDTLIQSGQVAVADGNPGDTVTVSLGANVVLEGGGALTSNGVAIHWTASPDGHTLTGTAGVGGPTILTVTIDNSGNWNVTLSGHLDHPPGGAENLLALDVPLTATDSHSATGTGTLTIHIEDDTPFVTLADVSTPNLSVSEVTLGTPASGDFSVLFNDHFGADGAASSGPTAYSLSIVSAGADSGLVDTATGNHVFLFLENGQVVGREGANAQAAASGSIDFAIAVNNSTGVVTLTQDRALVQPDGTQPDTHEPVSMASGLVSVTQTITDGDGDQANASVDISAQLHFLDAGPTANPDTNSVDEGSTLTVLAGSVADVLHNDSSGADGYHSNPGPVVGVEAGTDTSAPVITGVDTQIQGQFGVLTLHADGSYAYVAAPNTGGGVDQFVYTVEDGDGDYSTTTLDITVNNVSGAVGTDSTTVSEEALPTGNHDLGGADGDSGNDVTQTQGQISLTDSDPTATFVTSLGIPSGIYTSDGVQIVWTLSNNGQTLTGTAGNSGPTIITVTIDNSGNWTTTLSGPLDHPTGNGENALLITVPVDATDNHGNIAAPGSLAVTVEDDTPVASGATISATVSEEALPTGNHDLGGADGDASDDVLMATGSVSTLFTAGADTPLTYGFAANSVATLQALGLTSGGVALTYSISGDTVTATAGLGGPTVFTFQLTSAGTYTFTLDGHLDHAPGGGENTLAIDLGAIVTATDSDGDPATAAANALVINVQDDTPVATSTVVSGTVSEEVLPTGNNDAAGGTATEPVGDHDALVASGSVATMFSAGADAPLTFSISSNWNSVLTGLGLTSNGTALTYTLSNGTITAKAGATTIFTLALTSGGTYTFTLDGHLDHPAPVSGSNENILDLNLGALVTATDSDGDSVAGNANSLVIHVEDDTPVLGTIDNGTHSDHPADPAITGNLHFGVGADSPGVVVSISDTGDLVGGVAGTPTVGGVPVATSFDAGTDTLTGYLDNNHNGIFDAGDTKVYTLTESVTGGAAPGAGTWTFQLFQPLDGAPVSNLVSTSSSFGSGPTGFQTLLAGSTPVALLSGFDAGVNSTTLSLSGATQGGVNGATAGWGVDNNNFDTGEAIVVDFHTPASGSAFPPGYAPPGTFSSPTTDAVTVAFPHFSVGDTIQYIVYYGDPNGTGNSGIITHVLTATDISTGFEIDAPAGKSIDYVEFYDKSGSGKFQVVSTGTISNVANDQLNFSTTLADSDGDKVTGTFHVTVSGSATPIVLDLNGNGVQFDPLSAGHTFNYGSGVVDTAWAGSGDGVLALQTANGLVVSFAQFVTGATTDLQGLAAFDTNHDGKLDAGDAQFSQFGVIVNGAFHSLASEGISSITLTSDGMSYQAANGDVVVHGGGTFTWANGSTGKLADASFATKSIGSVGSPAGSGGGANDNGVLAGLLSSAAGASGLAILSALDHDKHFGGPPTSGGPSFSHIVTPSVVTGGGDLLSGGGSHLSFGPTGGHDLGGHTDLVSVDGHGVAGDWLGGLLSGLQGLNGPPAGHAGLNGPDAHPLGGAVVDGGPLGPTPPTHGPDFHGHMVTPQTVGQVLAEVLQGGHGHATLPNLIESLPHSGGSPLNQIGGGQGGAHFGALVNNGPQVNDFTFVHFMSVLHQEHVVHLAHA
jgi:T1SS-143 domain-containing protein